VLTTYDRSTFVPETLRLLTLSAEHLKDAPSATRHRETLVSLFPQSPAAREFMNARRPEQAAVSEMHREEKQITSVTPGLDAPPETTAVAPSIPTAPATLEAGHAGGH
jgi:hypothetical protein